MTGEQPTMFHRDGVPTVEADKNTVRNEQQSTTPVSIHTGAPAEDRERLSAQCVRIVALLVKGPKTNDELAQISRKYTSRISDLRKIDGVHIPPPERLDGKGLTLYMLARCPDWLRRAAEAV